MTASKTNPAARPPALPVDPAGIPGELKAIEQWVRWRWEWRDERSAWTKVPIEACRGRRASTDKPETWGRFEDALEHLGRDATDGIGFVFSAADPYCGIDLDSCRDAETGDLTQEAAEVVDALDAYTEVSPSGTGLHVILLGRKRTARCRRGGIEVYDGGRFFVMTGRAIRRGAEPIPERQRELDAVLERLFEAEASSCPASATEPLDAESAALLERAVSARNGEKLPRLLAGDGSGYPSQSEAEMALCCRLAFLTKGDETLIDRLFRRSGLMRAKWDERRGGATYGERTIGRAVAYWRKRSGHPRALAEVSEAAASGGESWKEGLLWRVGANGAPKKLERVVANPLAIFENDARWKGLVAWDAFARRLVVRGALPFQSADAPEASPERPWSDADDIETAAWLQREHGLLVGAELVAQAALAAGKRRSFHPVRDSLESLVWDGVGRLDRWLSTYLGADDTPYTRAVGSRWLISAVARVFTPGCKADHVLILEGPQALGKSTALRVLGKEWFTDELDALGSKDAAAQLQGAWIVELSELDALGRAEVSRTKAFISKSFDRFRPAYGRYVEKFERSCVFAGTVNHTDYLRDETGSRRFWPVACRAVTPGGQADIAALQRDRDQLFAEALVRYRQGEPWWLDSPELADLARGEQDARYAGDVWEPVVAAWVEGRSAVSVGEVLAKALGVATPDQGQAEQNRVARILKRLGRLRVQKRLDGVRTWFYLLPSPVGEPSPVDTDRSGDTKTLENKALSPLSPVSPLPNESLEREERAVEYVSPPRRLQIHGELIGGAGDTGATGDTGDTRPPRACPACGESDVWTSRSGVETCRRCHPPAPGAEEVCR